jgi:hypothetical protein
LFSIYTYDSSNKLVMLDRIAAETAEEGLRAFAKRRTLVIGTLYCKSNTPYDGCFSEDLDLKGQMYWARYGEAVDEGNGPARRAYYRDRKAGLLRLAKTVPVLSASPGAPEGHRLRVALTDVASTLRRALEKSGGVPVTFLVELVEALRISEEALAAEPSEPSTEDNGPEQNPEPVPETPP